jgi:opacity protein-like surface antigen
MKNIIFTTICFLALITISFGQETEKSKLSYGLNFGVGNSTLKNNKLGVLSGNLIAIEFNVDYSFTDNEETKLTSGVNILDFNSNFYNGTDQSRLKNEYFQIPLKLSHRVNFDKEEKLNLVVGVGIYANLLLRSKILNLNEEINTKSGGFNFGYNLSMGAEYKINTNTSFGLILDVMNEINEIKKNNYEQKQTEILLLSIGFSTRF